MMAARDSGPGATIVLRAGTFYLTDTIMLTSKDSGLTFQNYPNEMVTISGGKVIKPVWQPVNTDNSMNIYKADLSSQVNNVLGFRINGVRGIRA